MRRALLASALGLLLAACAVGPRWDGPETAHFDGERFVPQERFDKSIADLWRYWREKPPSQWRRDLSLPPGPPPPRRVPAGALRVTYVNHATLLVQADGLNLLTDPIWSEHAGPGGWLGPRRFRPPGLDFASLPPIDVVLVSHNHYDHLDWPTLARLQAAHRPVFVVPPGDGGWLRERGLQRVVERDWGQHWELPNGCRLYALEARHWSQRQFLPSDRNRSLWLAFGWETSQGWVYFAGDTGYGPHFAATAARLGPPRLALLPIGAYEPRWLTGYQHLDPAQAVRAHVELGALASLGMHWGSFELSAEGPYEPLADLGAALHAAGPDLAPFAVPAHGQGIDYAAPPPTARPQPAGRCRPQAGSPRGPRS